MIKQHKDILARIIRGLRYALLGSAHDDGTRTRGNLDRELEQLGIRPDGRVLPIDALPNATPQQQRAHYAAEVAIERMQQQGRSAVEARTEYLEQAAYSWINRLVALRALEARGLIDETLRPREEYGNLSEALYVLRQEQPTVAVSTDGGWWTVIERASAQQAQALPGLFSDADPVIALRPSTPVLLDCLKLIGAGPTGTTPDDTDAVFRDPDAIGWAYQFYQEETKQHAFASFAAGKKADSRATIAAATQLFTEPYMVKWLLHNSLGRTYHECYPHSTLPPQWDYYITPTSDHPLSPSAPTTPNLRSLTVLDPCVGSGHFLREAFDMLVAMYREQEPEWEATRIAENILHHHLYGIDIDPRAVQLTALTLYLRALDVVRTEAKNRKRPMPVWTPPEMNLATTPTALDEGALDRYLDRHPEDRPLRLVLHGIFDNLQQAELLGSLLRPSHDIDAAIADVQRPYQQSLLDESDDTPAFGLNGRDPDVLKRLILDRVAATFHHESATADPADALFGREAERGVRLLQLLDQRYAVVVTNPPYMSSANMNTVVKEFVDKYYKSGKSDLYTTFIMRCLQLSIIGGRVAMITQQSWMFLRTFSDLRAIPEDKLQATRRKGNFTGLLRETRLEGLAHLGPRAFAEISGEVVNTVLFTIRNYAPSQDHSIVAFRLVGLRGPGEKAKYLLASLKGLRLSSTLANGIASQVKQRDFFSIPGTPIVYWIPKTFVSLLSSKNRLENPDGIAFVRRGLTTGDVGRFIRFHWEAPSREFGFGDHPVVGGRWFRYQKGGGHRKWAGLHFYKVDWGLNGALMSSGDIPGARIDNPHFYFVPGISYSLMAQGSMSARRYTGMSDFSGLSIFPVNPDDWKSLLAILNNRCCSFLLRIITQDIKFAGGYTALLPLPDKPIQFAQIGEYVYEAKQTFVSAHLLEDVFYGIQAENFLLALAAIIHCVEGVVEQNIMQAYCLSIQDRQLVIEETGAPVGFYPLIIGYDKFPPLPTTFHLPPLPRQVNEYLAQHERMSPTQTELARVKANLRALYEAGPGAKDVDQDEGDSSEDELEEIVGGGAHIPIPTETFLEELSVKFQIHPISVYWLLEELRAEGVRCKPEERRLLEDRLSVLVLRLLGHRWPKQLEAGEPVPDWADRDGIIPLTLGGDVPMVERLRERLRAEDGDVGAQRTEALLVELTGAANLDDWLRRVFSSRHVRQFKFRPIAWHLASRPVKGKGKSARPLFECLLYYHATAGDALARLRTQYVEPLLRAEEAALTQVRTANNVEAAATITPRVQELQDFVTRLREVERDGFGCSDLDKLLANELLDRWSGDGLMPPTNLDDLLRAERAWHVDLNDGVRVNIAPLQLAGLLASDVLKTVDAKKAIADRARWRSDERRWVREGKLPRCGWMPDSVLESPEWTRRAPDRQAEQAKLEAKRQAALTRLNGAGA